MLMNYSLFATAPLLQNSGSNMRNLATRFGDIILRASRKGKNSCFVRLFPYFASKGVEIALWCFTVRFRPPFLQLLADSDSWLPILGRLAALGDLVNMHESGFSRHWAWADQPFAFICIYVIPPSALHTELRLGRKTPMVLRSCSNLRQAPKAT